MAESVLVAAANYRRRPTGEELEVVHAREARSAAQEEAARAHFFSDGK